MRDSNALVFLNTTKAGNFPTDYLCFKMEWKKIVDVREEMIIPGRIMEWNSSLNVRGKKGQLTTFGGQGKSALSCCAGP